MNSLVLTILSEDKPGLVDSISSVITNHQSSWQESRMCRLGGQFAGILHIHTPPDQEQSLIQALKSLQSQGMTIAIDSDTASTSTSTSATAFFLEIVGQDRPGIVQEISRCLAEQQVNVEELHTECINAPMSGEILFQAKAQLKIPQTCQVEILKKNLEKIAADLMVDLNFDTSSE